LSSNFLTELPELAHLPRLKELNISHNHISSLEMITVRLVHNSTFKNLQSLDFSFNKIDVIKNKMQLQNDPDHWMPDYGVNGEGMPTEAE
jgi:Leucine-rich repeat (LRR) protein